MTKFKVLTDRLNTFFTNNKITTGNSIPTSGEWNVGDICISSIQENGECGWICTESGTPGKWEIFGSGGSGKLVSLSSSVEVTGPVTEVSLTGLGTNVSENDKLFVHYNSTHLLEGVDFEIISNGTKIRKLNGGSWNESSSNAMFAFELLKHVKKVNGDNILLDSKMCVLKSNKTISAPTSEVEIGIDGFNKDSDYLTVYVNSTYLTEGVDYNISSDSRKIVSLNGNWNEESLSDYRFSFVVVKEVGIINPEAVVGTENLKDGSVTMSKLGEDVKDNFNYKANVDELDYVNIERFGVKGDCIWGGLADSIPTGTDNTQYFQEAIDYCISNKKDLYIPAGNYLITDTIRINGKINIKGSGINKTTIVCELLDANKSAFVIGGCEGTIENFRIGCVGYLGKSGIEFIQPQNEAIRLEKIHVNSFRYGISTFNGETISRAIFSHCQLISNIFSGIYIESFRDDESWEHSAPVTFYDCICNANGVHDWMNGFKYKEINILNSTDKKHGYQAYFRGITNLAWYGGQISNHGDAKNIAMLFLKNINGAVFDGIDIEDFKDKAIVKRDGTQITSSNQCSNTEGATVLLDSVRGSFFRVQAIFRLNSPYLFKLVNSADTHTIDFIKDGYSTYEYSVHVIGMNYDNRGNMGRICSNSDVTQFTPQAISMLVNYTKSNLTKVICKDYIRPFDYDTKHDWLFDFTSAIGSYKNKLVYVVGYAGSDLNNPNFKHACYIEKEVYNPINIQGCVYVSQNSFIPDNKFFIAHYGADELIKIDYFSLKGNQHLGNDVYPVFINSQCSGNVDKVRYGFINTANYSADLQSNCSVLGLDINAFYSNSAVTNIPTNRGGDISQKLKKQFSYLSECPVDGEGWFKNHIVYNTNMTADNPYIGWACVESYGSGKFNEEVSALVSTNAWQGAIIFDKITTNLSINDVITIEGIPDTEFKILNLYTNPNTSKWQANITPAMGNYNLNNVKCFIKNPVFKPFGRIEF